MWTNCRRYLPAKNTTNCGRFLKTRHEHQRGVGGTSQPRKGNFVDAHGDIIKWKHFPHYWPFVREFTGHWWVPLKGQWRGVLMVSLICAWTNGWVNNPDVGDLGRHRAHYDVTVMLAHIFFTKVAVRCATWSRQRVFLWIQSLTYWTFVAAVLCDNRISSDRPKHKNVMTWKRFPHCWPFMRIIHGSPKGQ